MIKPRSTITGMMLAWMALLPLPALGQAPIPKSALGDKEIPDRVIAWAAVIVTLLVVSVAGSAVVKARRRRHGAPETDASATHALTDFAAAPVPAWHAPTSLMIVATNLVPLWAVLAQGCSAFELFMLFWLETVVVIVMNAMRMLFARPGDLGLWFRKIIEVPASCILFGVFASCYAVGIFAIFSRPDYLRMSRLPHVPIDEALAIFSALQIWEPLAAIAMLYVIQFLFGYILSGEYRTADPKELSGKLMRRMGLLHVTLIFGGFATMVTGSPVWAMFVLIFLKTAVELLLHLGHLRFTE